jgi:hypothetical protein
MHSLAHELVAGSDRWPTAESEGWGWSAIGHSLVGVSHDARRASVTPGTAIQIFGQPPEGATDCSVAAPRLHLSSICDDLGLTPQASYLSPLRGLVLSDPFSWG